MVDKKKPPIIEHSRRFREREYNPASMRELFNIPINEFMINLRWDKDRNKVILETAIDYNKGQGDK